MRLLKLSQGFKAIVDDCDFEFLNQYKWTAMKQGKYGHRAMRGFSYFKDGKPKHKPILMHRAIMMCPEGFEVDHIDGNGLNNQKSNLRICSHAQNMRNRRHKSQTSSKYKGVHEIKHGSQLGKWGSRLQVNYKIVHDEYYDSEIEAAKAYNEAAIRHHGEFAMLNRIEG